MPIHYDIETDELYLAGLEKGIEKGMEKGIEKGIEKGMEKGMELTQYDTVVRLIQSGRFSDEEIAEFAGVTVEYVQQVRMDINLFQ